MEVGNTSESRAALDAVLAQPYQRRTGPAMWLRKHTLEVAMATPLFL